MKKPLDSIDTLNAREVVDRIVLRAREQGHLGGISRNAARRYARRHADLLRSLGASTATQKSMVKEIRKEFAKRRHADPGLMPCSR